MISLGAAERNSLQRFGFAKLTLPDWLREPARYLMEASNAVHDMPIDALEKISLGNTPGLRGYVGLRTVDEEERSLAEKSRSYRCFEFGHSIGDARGPLEQFLCAANVWPTGIERISDRAEAALDKFHYAALEILTELSPHNEGKISRYFNRPTGNMRLIKYFDNSISNIPYHTDYEFLTLINASKPSLSVRAWQKDFYVDESVDDLIVLIGDSLEYCSNGFYKAANHGAIPDGERISTVYFLCSNANVSVDRHWNFHVGENGNESFSPAKHVAGMALANNVTLRRVTKQRDLLDLVPLEMKNPFKSD